MEKSKKKGAMAKISGPAFGLLLLLCFTPMIVSDFSAAKSMYDLLSAVGAQDAILNMATSVGAIVTLVFGLTMVVTYFYTTSDLPILLALPLKPTEIVAAKFTLCIGYEYMMILLFTGPMLAGFGVASGGGILYWITMVLVCLLLPVIPLSYATILIMLFMRIFRRVRNKQILTVITTIAAVGIALFISFFAQNLADADSDKLIGTVQSLKQASILFPQLNLANKALQGSNLLFLLLFILSVAVTFGIFLFLARLFYFKGAIGMTEVAAKSRVLNEKETEKYIKRSAPVRTYVMTEIHKVLRSPTYFLNGVLMDLIWPVFFLIPIIMQAVNGSTGEGSTSVFSVLAYVAAAAKKETSLGILLLILLGVVFIFGSLNLMTPSTISREGRGLWFMKTIPMSYKKQLQAKIISSLPFSLLATLLYGYIFGIIAIVYGMTPLVLLYMTLIAVPGVMLINYIQLLFDLKWPKLVWQNEAVPIKQNFHSIAAWGVCIAIGCVIAAAGVLPYLFLHLSLTVCIWIVIVLIIAVMLILRPLTYRYGEKRMMELS